jgi:transposase
MNRWRRIMATIAAHLSVEALRERYVSSSNAREARHFQTIWLLAKGHSVGEVVEMTSFGRRWIEQLAARYNAEGPEALGDLRRRNGSAATVLKRDVLDKLRLRLKEPPDDGGLWTSAKVAAFLARELGLENVAAQRGWEALKACGMSIQAPRPKNPKSASPEEAAAFKKSWKTSSPRKPQNIPNGRSKCSRVTSIGSA